MVNRQIRGSFQLLSNDADHGASSARLHCLQITKGYVKRSAFILIDGLSIEQWLAIKEELRTQDIGQTFEENALFAWIPSITPISRQAAFSGKIPRYFPESIMETDRDELRWRHFWSNQGMASGEVGFVKVRGDIGDVSAFESLDLLRLRALAVTIFKVDRIMHGMQLGAAGMIDQVRTWTKEGFLRSLISLLFQSGFEVIISSDHGNLEAVGTGVPRQGVLSDKRGQRSRFYSEEILFKKSLEEIPGSKHWENSALPENLYVLLAPYGKAFFQNGARIVCHGGASLEEVAVPFVHLAA